MKVVDGGRFSSGLLPLPRLNVVFLQLNGTVSPVNFVVKTTGVTDWSSLLVPPPEGGGGGAAVGALDVPRPPGGLGLAGGGVVPQYRPVGAVHLVVETAGVTEIVATGVSPPERSVTTPTVDALPVVLVGHTLLGAGRGRGAGGLRHRGGGGGGGGRGGGWWVEVPRPVVCVVEGVSPVLWLGVRRPRSVGRHPVSVLSRE